MHAYPQTYIHTDHHSFAEDGHLLNSLRVLMAVLLTPQVKYILVNPIACVTKELAFFSIDIPPIHPCTTCQTCCCRPTCFATELTPVTSRLPLKDL